jgi:hypothetical protein
MSRAGKPQPEPAPPPAPEPPSPEVLAMLERRARGERMFMLCRARIIEKYPSLWPGEIVGASIGDQWFRNVARRMQAAALEAQRGRTGAAGIVVPS